MSDTRGQRLRFARRKRFASARAAALALGLPISTYGAHERAELPGARDYGPAEAQRYAEFFGVTAEWLLIGHGVEDAAAVAAPRRKTSQIKPIIGYVGKGAQAYFFAVSPKNFEWVALPKVATADTVALEIRGKSMGSHLDRWLVLYDDTRKPPTADLIGVLCVAALKDGRVLIKKLQQGGAEGSFDLISQAADPIRDAGILWAANVKAIIQRSRPAPEQK